jgi:neutral ceramidase
MAGYASRKELSAGVHDELGARALVFESNGRRLALVSVDLLGFYAGTAEPLREAILRRTGLKPSELFLAAIHTHAGPSLSLDREKNHANNVGYTESLGPKLADLVAQALANLQPAAVAVGVGASPVGVNRRELQVNQKGETAIVLGRNPSGTTDKEVLVLRVTEPGGSPVGVAFGYATHATSLGPGNLMISGDVLGLAEQTVERISDSGGLALAFAGASGDIDPWYRVLPGFNTEPGWTPEPILLGNFLGQEVVQVYRKARPLEALDLLNSTLRVIDLPAKPVEGAGEPAKETLPLILTAARVGDLAIIGLGGEILTEIGMAIKAGSPFQHTLVITHCNGAAGYLAPKHLHVEGGYEVRTSRFSAQAAEILVREAIELLHSLKEKR